MKLNIYQKIAGELAVRRMNKEAQELYNGSLILVWEYDSPDADGGKLYAYGLGYSDIFEQGLTFDRMNECLTAQYYAIMDEQDAEAADFN